ncbi:Methionyl-tRNA formyltransferase, mitochondrial [Lecanosticta acicola]|uniref:methionyl-tRNA formyltransferase n=1 Tax=Lecanosticta acicola TaxID=111012 RepID=A0AAI9EB83_9PEZI|nr:Methionyl-tRNA formyltransferase, mitochondrial [Lecanosticta acicola]
MLRTFFARPAKRAIRPTRIGGHFTSRLYSILFCGADEFSIYSLRAVHRLLDRTLDKVQSIEVVCRPAKRVGRGLQEIQEPPIKSVAEELSLPVYQLDTFTGWKPRRTPDLIIAVSFGLLIPARLLREAKYGGLNVHPSLLPDLRGPAPIQHALLKGRTHTGVSLQDMHHTKFDHGKILDQMQLAIPEDCTVEHLIDTLGPIGASMLQNIILRDLKASPLPISGADASQGELEHAPKITPEDRHIDWSTWTSDKILRYDRVLGRLWDRTTYQYCHGKPQEAKRITFEGPWRRIVGKELLEFHTDWPRLPGRPTLNYKQKKPMIGVWTVDESLLAPSYATVEGGKPRTALAGLRNLILKHSELSKVRTSQTS